MYLRLIWFLMKERIGLFFKQKTSGQHWCRVIMDQETDRLIRSLDYKELSVLEISGDKWKNFSFKKYENTDYPSYDVCSGVLKTKYDLIIAEQVFEHLLRPYQAGKNVYEMLNPGGYFLITTPFLLRIHPHPVDCSRWTETGLQYFLAECGFNLESIVTDSWGNLECLLSNYNRWTVFDKGNHSLEKDPLVPLVVWALAKK